MIELKLKCIVHLGKQITENIYFPVVTYMQLLSWTFPLLSTQWIEILEQPVTDDINMLKQQSERENSLLAHGIRFVSLAKPCPCWYLVSKQFTITLGK